MGTITPEELANLWRQEKLTADMAIGHITQNLVALQSGLIAQRELLNASLETQREFLSVLQHNLTLSRAQPDASKKIRRASK